MSWYIDMTFNSIVETDCNFILFLVHVAGIKWMFMLSVTWDNMDIINMIYIELEVIIE